MSLIAAVRGDAWRKRAARKDINSMAHGYGVRYMVVHEFETYCKKLNVRSKQGELEHYERIGVMLPTIRVILPDDYALQLKQWSLGLIAQPPYGDQWPDLARIFDRHLVFPADYLSLTDDELIDSFDRELGKTPYLVKPKPDGYQPWDSYSIQKDQGNGKVVIASTAEHRYSYWQVHQLHLIRQFPDLHHNYFFLEQVPDEIKRRFRRPHSYNIERYRSFKGMAHHYDALSFYIVMYNRQQMRTFAEVPEQHQIQRLDETQAQKFTDRLKAHAQTVVSRFSLSTDDMFVFLSRLLELHSDYLQSEHHKLAEELCNDIVYQTRLINGVTGLDWLGTGLELEKRTHTNRRVLQHIDPASKEFDEARQVLVHFAGQYAAHCAKAGVANTSFTFTETDVDALLAFAESIGLSVLINALSNMIADKDEYDFKFRRVNRYTHLKNLATCLEYLMKATREKTSRPLAGMLTPIVQEYMKGRATWIGVFNTKLPMQGGLTNGKTSGEFLSKLTVILSDSTFAQSEETMWARSFLVACLVRNLVVHMYLDEDWFYGELYGEMLSALLYATMYAWRVGTYEGWIPATTSA